MNPMETAPKDKVIVLHTDDGHTLKAKWGSWIYGGNKRGRRHTYWCSATAGWTLSPLYNFVGWSRLEALKPASSGEDVE